MGGGAISLIGPSLPSPVDIAALQRPDSVVGFNLLWARQR